jgi:K+-transporting ATPase ATPase C chain
MSDELPIQPKKLSARKILGARLGVNLRPALVGLLLLTVITGSLFPLALFSLGSRFFSAQVAGSLIVRDGVVVGSAWIGQGASAPGYFHPRPSAAGSGYDATASGGTNFGPYNRKLVDLVTQYAQEYRKENGLAPSDAIPVDAVTSSASGLDPHITPENAALQIPRVARARGLSDGAVRDLVDANTEGRQFGFLGQPRVSVLSLNLALGQATVAAKR